MVRILSRRGDRTETPAQRVADEDAMVADGTEPAVARGTATPAPAATADPTVDRDMTNTADDPVARHPGGTTYGRTGPVVDDTPDPAATDRVGPVEHDRVGPVEHDRVGPVEHDGVGPVEHGDRTGVIAPVPADRTEPVDDGVGPVPAPEPVPARPRWNRVSFGATLGLILGLTALYAVLTGTLAQVGLLVGVLGFLLASAGFAGARRDGVTGHSLALLGMLCSAGAIVLGVLAITDTLSWLSTGRDNVPLVRDWVNAHLPWIKNW